MHGHVYNTKYMDIRIHTLLYTVAASIVNAGDGREEKSQRMSISRKNKMLPNEPLAK